MSTRLKEIYIYIRLIHQDESSMHNDVRYHKPDIYVSFQNLYNFIITQVGQLLLEG